MTSKQEIRDLFTTELLLTPQYQIILNVKQLILNQIATPSIQRQVVYNYEQPITKEEVEIVKMCFLIEFGWLINNISEMSLVVDMSKFLE
jgi:hypothetical protein